MFWSLKIGVPAIRTLPGPIILDDIHLGIDDMVMQLPTRTCSARKDKGKGRSNHSKCEYSGGGDLLGKVARIYAEILPTIFEESYRKHMEEQARK